jgi:hypothetical protein
MRWFFTLLMLTNLTLAGWLYWQNKTLHSESPIGRGTVQGRLQLLGELPQQSLQPIANTPEVPSSEIPGASLETGVPSSEPAAIAESLHAEEQATCIRISPLAKAADVEKLTRKLVQANITVLDSGEGFTERLTYWVMIPPYKSDKAARDAAAELAKAKVRDFLVVRSGEYENGVSLGLFSQMEGAESRLREINALKLTIRKPEIRIRTSSVRSHWLTARVSGEKALMTLQHQLDAEGVQSTTAECPP